MNPSQAQPTQDESKPPKRVSTGYRAVLVFAIVLAALLALRAALPTGALDGIEMLVLLALIAALPLLIEYFRPMLSGLEVGALLKLSFRDDADVKASSAGLKEVEDFLAGLDATSMQAEQYLQNMTSYSVSIVTKTREIATLDSEVILVDLGLGQRWVFANLYFLTLLLEHRTRVRQLVFVENRAGREGTLVGLCSVSELRVHLSAGLPHLAHAAEAVDTRYDKLDPSLGTKFFDALQAAVANDPHAADYKRWVTPASLLPIMGSSLSPLAVNWTGKLSASDCRALLGAQQPCVPAVRDGQLAFVLDRDRVSLAIARQAVSPTT